MLAQSPNLIPKVEKALVELEKLFYSEYTVGRQLSYDDIDVFGQLRGLTLVKVSFGICGWNYMHASYLTTIYLGFEHSIENPKIPEPHV